jgi:hypothetical protein
METANEYHLDMEFLRERDLEFLGMKIINGEKVFLVRKKKLSNRK